MSAPNEVPAVPPAVSATLPGDLVLDADVYEPSVGEGGVYMDYLPPARHFVRGIRCPCSQREHVFRTRTNFALHTKTSKHKDWLAHLNAQRDNYFQECERLRDLVNSQTRLIARLEREKADHEHTIAYLSRQLRARDEAAESVADDLLSFD